MNNNEFMKLAQTLNSLAYQFQRRPDVPFKFLYGVRKNLALVNPKAIELQNKLKYPDTKYPEKFDECEQERMNICIKYAKKDTNGLPIINGQMYDMDKDNIELFNSEIKVMMDKYPEIREERETADKAINEILSEGAPDIEYHKINIAHFPADGITSEQLDVIMPLIDETAETPRLIKMVN